MLQAACQLSYVGTNVDDPSNVDAQHLPQHSDDFQPIERETNENAMLEMDNIGSLSEPVILDDSQSLTDAEQYEIAATDRLLLITTSLNTTKVTTISDKQILVLYSLAKTRLDADDWVRYLSMSINNLLINRHGLDRYLMYALDACGVLFLCCLLSVRVQSIVWKESSSR